MKNQGIIYALLAYLLWGLAPIYWRLLDHVPSAEIVAHRMVWSSIFAVLTIVLMSKWREFADVLKRWKLLSRLLVASVLISVNWGIYIWAVNSGHIVESSMGYFINPLINVLFGVALFKEQLRPNQWLAIALAACGVAYLILAHGDVPYIALALALTFSSYGAVKKTIRLPAAQGMAIETGLAAVPALGFLVYLSFQGQLDFGHKVGTDSLLILGGAVTLAPLLFFSAAAQKISMTALGMTQYLGPSLQLIIGVWMFNEPFGSERQISFGLIWLGLFFYTLDQIRNHRRRKALEGGAGVVLKGG
ncbi:MAG: EamA family transporter RarD [Gammaproteobacteria bacterium]|nr:EamA family transporter RarD [Gammaproteobacteria bacterium]